MSKSTNLGVLFNVVSLTRQSNQGINVKNDKVPTNGIKVITPIAPPIKALNSATCFNNKIFIFSPRE